MLEEILQLDATVELGFMKVVATSLKNSNPTPESLSPSKTLPIILLASKEGSHHFWHQKDAIFLGDFYQTIPVPQKINTRNTTCIFISCKW